MEKRHEKRRILLIDMYGVIIKESKGYFIPYTYEHFEQTEYDRLTKAFREENLFTKAGNGDLSSDEFLSLLGYTNPEKTMQDYLKNYLTLDTDFLQFAENNYRQYDFVLLSNDVKEWSKYLFELHGLHKYFKASFVSGNVHMRKPEIRIFSYALEHIQCSPDECIFVDNSVKNLNAAQSIGIDTVLFNRDHESYLGKIVNSFAELEQILKNV
ncbi:MAG: HAD-IA family hydrolase [Lachnospiraceae bacterium]|nr:HAD-IA family hydrolase [Lachnospiraceae bacterium]MDE7203587.1 HAD-IA family hydrolase [Lachnospiraceae bacterium]